MLKKKLIQINLNDGRNYLFDKKTDVGDSVIINFKENKIQEILPFQEGCKIMFIKGKHIGEQGTVSNIDEKRKIIMVKTEAGEINAKQANLIVIR
jgi:ribosomal protein S4E